MDKFGSNWELPVWDLVKKIKTKTETFLYHAVVVRNVKYVEIFQNFFFKYFKEKLEIAFMTIMFFFFTFMFETATYNSWSRHSNDAHFRVLRTTINEKIGSSTYVKQSLKQILT